MDTVNVRDLEQIQESDGDRRATRVTTLFLASLGGAALVIAGVMTMKKAEPPAVSTDDPLAALVAKSKGGEKKPPERLDKKDVTFPSILSDADHPTTALAVVKDERGRLLEPSDEPADSPPAPPPGGDRLPVVPLPAGTLLSSTTVTKRPKDGLTQLAAKTSKVEASAGEVPAGAEGGYQIQVASFQKRPDADAFVTELRRRGHRAYRQAAYVPERGLWHRVRVGPFKTKFSGQKYKREFEQKEQMNTFLVDPSKVKRARQVRAAKLASRMKKYGRP